MTKLQMATLVQFIFLAGIGCERHPNYIEVTSEISMNDTIRSYRVNRGVMILNKKYLLMPWCPIVEGKVNKDWLHYGSRNKKKYDLGDITVPFILIKKPNDEKMLLIKDQDTVLVQSVDCKVQKNHP